jgi:hypothetical protein
MRIDNWMQCLLTYHFHPAEEVKSTDTDAPKKMETFPPPTRRLRTMHKFMGVSDGALMNSSSGRASYVFRGHQWHSLNASSGTALGGTATSLGRRVGPFITILCFFQDSILALHQISLNVNLSDDEMFISSFVAEVLICHVSCPCSNT